MVYGDEHAMSRFVSSLCAGCGNCIRYVPSSRLLNSYGKWLIYTGLTWFTCDKMVISIATLVYQTVRVSSLSTHPNRMSKLFCCDCQRKLQSCALQTEKVL